MTSVHIRMIFKWSGRTSRIIEGYGKFSSYSDSLHNAFLNCWYQWSYDYNQGSNTKFSYEILNITTASQNYGRLRHHKLSKTQQYLIDKDIKTIQDGKTTGKYKKKIKINDKSVTEKERKDEIYPKKRSFKRSRSISPSVSRSRRERKVYINTSKAMPKRSKKF